MVIIGQAPGKGDGAPLSGSCGRKLARLLEMPFGDYLQEVKRMNVLEEYPGSAGKGDLFPLLAARKAAERFDFSGEKVILLGRAVAHAFEVGDKDWFEWFECRGGDAAIAPHPSGVSRWWNDDDNRKRAEEFFRQLRRDDDKRET